MLAIGRLWPSDDDDDDDDDPDNDPQWKCVFVCVCHEKSSLPTSELSAGGAK